jgi:type 1 glutamine amidotransferase
MKRSLILFSAALLVFSLGRTQTPPAAQPQGGRGAAQGGRGGAAPPASAKKHVLVFGMTKGFHHDSVSNAMASVWKMGRDSGVWDTEISTDPGIIHAAEKPGGGFTPLNLANFDAIVFASTTGELPLDDQQKKDLLAFVHDEGKGFVGIHAALDCNYKWPEYAEMIGGWFDGHPWNTFDAPVIVEDGNFPATRHFAKSFRMRDEIYQPKQWSRDKVNVLMRLDESKLDLTRQKLREDRDWAIAWSKMYGKGRVFYSTLGHTNEAWDDPDVVKMYQEAIKWVLGRTDGSVAPHPRP